MYIVCLFMIIKQCVMLYDYLMVSVRILSVNCQGLGNIVKRTDVFNCLKKSSATSTVYKILIILVKMKRAYDQVGIMNVILAHCSFYNVTESLTVYWKNSYTNQ
jgi:hypothetical protein